MSVNAGPSVAGGILVTLLALVQLTMAGCNVVAAPSDQAGAGTPSLTDRPAQSPPTPTALALPSVIPTAAASRIQVAPSPDNTIATAIARAPTILAGIATRTPIPTRVASPDPAATWPESSKPHFSYRDTDGHHYLVAWDGKHRRRLMAHGDCSIQWAPSGKHFACFNWQRFLYDWKPGVEPEALALPFTFYDADGTSVLSEPKVYTYAWSPSGEYLAYAVPSEGEKPSQRVVYRVVRSGDGAVLHEFPGLIRQAIWWAEHYGALSWSFRGDQLAYRAGRTSIGILDLKQGRQWLIPTELEEVYAWMLADTWLVGGMEVGFGEFTSMHKIWLIHPLSGAREPIDVPELQSGIHRWFSPNGRQIAYVIAKTSRQDAVVALYDVGLQAAFSIPRSFLCRPADTLAPEDLTFSPSGHRITMRDACAGRRFIADATGSPATESPWPAVPTGELLSLSPKETHMLITRYPPTATGIDLWSCTNPCTRPIEIGAMVPSIGYSSWRPGT